MNRLPGLNNGSLLDLAPLRHGPLVRALQALNGGGEETRLVGGAVRDLVLGAKVEDFDLATTARPDEVIRRAEAAGFRIATPGISHGSVILIMHGQTIETTTLREDVETDGRHAKIVFGRDFLADARRRDFTINAVSLERDGKVHDPLGGLDDLAHGRVRFIGDADARIREDYLRILRFFRFSAKFGGGGVDAEGLSAAIRRRASIVRLSRERVRAELLKLVVAPQAYPVVQTMNDSGMFEYLFGFAYPGRFSRLVSIETARAPEADALLRLAALAVAIVEDAERLRERLRLANAEFERLASAARTLAKLHGISAPPPQDVLRFMLFSEKRRAARDALLLAQAESEASPDDCGFAHADRFLADAPEPEFPISGSDVIAFGVEEGPRVGEVLRQLRDLWARAGFPTDADALRRLIESAAEAQRPSEPTIRPKGGKRS